MIKKIYIFIFISLLIVSCGKKSDPVYSEKETKSFNTKFVVAV
jgi:hypothetical protein